MNAIEFMHKFEANPDDTLYMSVIKLMEEYHLHKSKPKGKTLEERKTNFVNKVDSYSHLYVLDEFVAYWTEHGDNDKKMRFEKEKSFGIKRRLATWKKNSKQWNTETKKESVSDLLKQKYRTS